MKTYTLKTTINGHSTVQKLNPAQAVKIQAQAGAQYELIDETGAVLTPVREGNSLKWLLPDGSEPIVWIESYGEQILMPVASGGEMVSPIGETVAIKSPTVVAAQTVGGSPLLWGAGALVAVGGIAAAASGGKGGGSSDGQNGSNPQNSPNPPSGTGNKSDTSNPLPVAKPEITLNAVTADNTLNRAESTDSVTVSGTVKNAANGDIVVLKIGNHNVETTIQNGSFSQAVDGKVLANANSITATISSKGGSHSVAKTYSVDAEIATPVIKLKPITADNIINIAESQQTAVTVSGSVQNAKDGDTVVLRVGNAEYRATVAKGEFSAVVDGKTLANHQSISATVDTADQAGNTAQGKVEHAYRVVTTPPTGTISLDAITGDNVINKAEAQGKITVSGRTDKVADGSEVIISCGCPNCASTVDKTAVVHGGMFSVEFDGSELVADGRHVMIARVNVRDEAGNTAEVSDSQGYTVAIADPAVTLTWNKVTADNIINHKESQEKITLSGSIGTLKSGETATVAVKIGSETLTAVVKDGSYSVEADGSKLAQNKQAEAMLTVIDQNGNRAEKSVVQAYQVDTDLAKPVISIDKLNQGKTLNHQNSLNTVTVSGSLNHDSDVNPAATRVSVKINGETHDATVTGNRWQTSIAGSKLAQNQGANSITVQAQVTDKAGNSADSSAKADYRVDTLAPSAKIELDKIAGDNVLSHTEAQNSVTVSGKVTGEFKANDALTLSANGKAVQTTVQADGKFSAVFQGSDLAASGSREVKAQMNLRDDAGNESRAENSVTYRVENAPVTPPPTPPVPPAPKPEPAAIHLNQIDPEVMTDRDFIRIGGKVQLDGAFAVGYNKHRLHAVTVKIGDKSYRSVVDPQTQKFVVDIAESDLPSIQGKAVSYEFETEKQIYDLVTSQNEGFHYYAKPIDTPKLNANHIVLDNNTPIANNVFDLAADTRSRTEISGKVSGDAKAGDTLVLTVGGKNYETVVNQDLSFRQSVDSELLADNGSVQAVLRRDGVQKAATEAHLSRAPELSADFVSAHTIDRDSEGGRPYFINSLLVEGKNSYKFPTYHNERAPIDFSKAAVLPYQFFNQNTLNYFEFKDKDVAGVKKALDIISQYANIHFEEMPNAESKDIAIRFYIAKKQYTYSNAHAYYGGDVYLGDSLLANGKSLSDDYPLNVVLHEVLHSLGAEHPHQGKTRMPRAEDSRLLTALSYNEQYLAYPQLGIFDVAFLHYRFGVNPNVRKGNDVYRFRAASDHSVERDVYIWDGGGVDTFDASDQTQGVNVNLTPGSWIYVGQKTQNFLMAAQPTSAGINTYFGQPANININGGVDKIRFNNYTQNQAFIGYGTQIEKLIGSDYDDTLTGNNAANAIYGGKGKDTISGGGGNDYLDGGADADKMSGGVGDDIYVVDNATDTVTEVANEGSNDTVHSYIDFRLPENVENLHLYGTENVNAIGNALANVLKGNAADNRLEGGSGNDTLTGGKGHDTFVFSDLLESGIVDSITDFTVGEDTIALSKSVFTALEKGKVMEHIRYDSNTGALSYAADGKTVHFATIGAGLQIDENSFSLI